MFKLELDNNFALIEIMFIPTFWARFTKLKHLKIKMQMWSKCSSFQGPAVVLINKTILFENTKKWKYLLLSFIQIWNISPLWITYLIFMLKKNRTQIKKLLIRLLPTWTWRKLGPKDPGIQKFIILMNILSNFCVFCVFMQ